MQPPAEDICRIKDGSTNEYLVEPRKIEDFLKDIEPKYNRSVEKVLSGEIDNEAIFVIAGFVSYIAVCSPTAMRVQADLLRRNLKLQVEAMEACNLIPPPPQELGDTTLSDLINRGAVELVVDEKYPQAIGINQIYEFIRVFGNSDWDVLINDHEDCPFVTSDYPIGLEVPPGAPVQNKIVPLTPRLAIRIHPRWELPSESLDLSFDKFRTRVQQLRRTEVVAINRILVRSAEDLVCFPVYAPWVPMFMKKHSGFRIDRHQQELGDGHGKYIIDSQVIAKVTRN